MYTFESQKIARSSFSKFSSEHRHFRGFFRPNHGELVGMQVSGDLSGFRGIFRPKHGELDIIRGTILFISSRTMIFVFESLNFVKY
ncbi:unnamed protein product [Malus baccata var. baccata]